MTHKGLALVREISRYCICSWLTVQGVRGHQHIHHTVNISSKCSKHIRGALEQDILGVGDPLSHCAPTTQGVESGASTPDLPQAIYQHTEYSHWPRNRNKVGTVHSKSQGNFYLFSVSDTLTGSQCWSILWGQGLYINTWSTGAATPFPRHISDVEARGCM